MSESDSAYYTRRCRDEMVWALKAKSAEAEAAHYAMAMGYAKMARASSQGDDEVAPDRHIAPLAHRHLTLVAALN